MYLPARPLWKHQEAGLRLMSGRPAFALLYEMRCGKTPTLLADFFSSDTDDLLVVAPAGCYRTWLTAIDEHVRPEVRADTYVYLWSSDDRAIHYKFGPDFREKRHKRVLIVDIEALSAVQRARELVLSFAGARGRLCMIAVDESVCVKNPDAKRGDFVVDQLGPLGAYRRILTGLPTPRSPLDIYQQFAFLDKRILGAPDYDSFFKFHAITKWVPNQAQKRYVKVVTGYREVERIYDRIAPHSHRVLRSECYDVPEKSYKRWEVPLTREQSRLYDELRQFATAKLESKDYVTAGMVVVQMLRMHQVLLGHAVDDEFGKIHEVPTNRSRELIKILDGVPGKAVVWCSYDHSVRAVQAAVEEEYGPGSVARFWGGNTKTREAEERQFKEDPVCRVMVGTPAAGRFGREWSIANTVIYYSSTPDLDHRLQSEDRAQGVGKRDYVTYVDMIAPGTIEEKFLKVLREKKRLADVVTGDDFKEWL